MTSIKKRAVQPIAAAFLVLLNISCQGQNSANAAISDNRSDAVVVYGPMPNPITKTQIIEQVRVVFEDQSGNVWFGSEGRGVCRYDGQHYTYFSPDDLRSGFGGNLVHAIIQDRQQNLWFATNGGLTRYDGKVFKNFTTADGLAHTEIWSLHCDDAGRLWVGTTNGVSVSDGKTFKKFALPFAGEDKVQYGSHAASRINSIIEDSKGEIWFGSNGAGMYRYDGQTLQHITESDGLGSNFVQALLEDARGNLWIGTRDGGLSRFDGKSFLTFTEKDGLENNFVSTLFEDANGSIWIGGVGRGLHRFDGKSFHQYSETDGLPNTHVKSLMQDRKGNLWIGTAHGVYQFDGERFINMTREVDARDGC